MRDEPFANSDLSNQILSETHMVQSRSAEFCVRKISRSKTTTDVADRSLSPVSSNAMNALKGKPTPSIEHTKISRSNTIRSVPAESSSLSTTKESPSRRSQTPSDSSIDMPHYTRDSTAPGIPSIPSVSSISTITLPRHHSNSTGLSVTNGLVRRISSEFGPTRSQSTPNGLYSPDELLPHTTNGSIDTHESGSSSTNGIGQVTSPVNGSSPQWSTAVGRSTLGKSGRVIEKLQNQLDTMRRELASEKANTAEYKNAVSLTESRMAQMKEEYDMALHEAAIAKAALKRRDRQNADLKAQVESEKKRAEKAMEREKGWREQMEQIEADAKVKIEEAQTHAALMDGRVKAMTSHWHEQKAEVNKTVGKLRTEITKIQEARKADDDRIKTLDDISKQQKDELKAVIAEKEEIYRQFEEYKRQQEKGLLDIKSTATAKLEETEANLDEAQVVLGHLKWALNLQKNTRESGS